MKREKKEKSNGSPFYQRKNDKKTNHETPLFSQFGQWLWVVGWVVGYGPRGRGGAGGGSLTSLLPARVLDPSDPQQTEDSRSHYSAATAVPALLTLGSLSRTGKLARSNDPVANVEEEMSRRKRERDLDSVRTMSDRQNLMNSWNGKLTQPFEETLQLR